MSSDTLLKNAYVNVTRTLENDIRSYRINYWASEVKRYVESVGICLPLR